MRKVTDAFRSYGLLLICSEYIGCKLKWGNYYQNCYCRTRVCTTYSGHSIFAANEVSQQGAPVHSVSQFHAQIPPEVVGLDHYIVRQSDGTLYLDADSAIKEGYKEEVVKGIKSHLKDINKGVLEGKYTTDKNLSCYL
ncbi:hypothetical protein HMSSN036_05400 [Paenibacillus macerans]|uniref:hypothetical protein n=1 Tax=Paenibacillus sp. FSL R5-0527 TaxID=2975321 RepID=UPI002085508C|nr:hypothetical protein HMSSN036_05400 [Paenibacillus macerans]